VFASVQWSNAHCILSKDPRLLNVPTMNVLFDFHEKKKQKKKNRYKNPFDSQYKINIINIFENKTLNKLIC